MSEELAPNALTSLDAVRGFLQKEETETAQNDEIVRMVNAASGLIIRCFRREFAPVTPAGESDDPVERHFLSRCDQSGVIDLAPYDVRDVTAVQIDTDLAEDEQTALAEGDWKLRPVPAPDGVFQWLKLATPLTGERQITVTGAWGFAQVPDDVEHWCKVTVAIWLRRDVSAFSNTLRLDEDRVEKPKELPEAVIYGLRHYERASALRLR